MNESSSKLTVYFDDPFWVGVFERIEDRKRSAHPGVGTKAQQALQLQREENKLIRKTISRQQREAEKQRLFELKQQKRKEKHKGR